LLHIFNSEKGEPQAMNQTQAKPESVHPDPHNWTRSEWFGMVGGFKSAPAEVPSTESPAKISGKASFKIDTTDFKRPDHID